MKKEATGFQESYRIPGHRQSNCHLEESDKEICLISYATKVAYFDKHSHRVYILGRYSVTTDRHCRLFLAYLHCRFEKPHLKVTYSWIDTNFRVLGDVL